jgi:hypothetical protein
MMTEIFFLFFEMVRTLFLDIITEAPVRNISFLLDPETCFLEEFALHSAVCVLLI